MAIGQLWLLPGVILSLLFLQLASLWLGDNTAGRAVGFILHGVSG
jgi:hypothetical protein